MLHIAISPCPNDTISFWPHLEKLFPAPFPLQVHFFELNELNSLIEKDLKGLQRCRYDIVKVSCSLLEAIEKPTSSWQLLDVGGAYSQTNGPKIVTNCRAAKSLEELDLIIPSASSSAYRIFSSLFPKHKNSLKNPGFTRPKVLPYHQILSAVAQDPTKAGLIIHESHLSLDPKVHHIHADLGEIWRENKHCPIPLGMQVARKRIDRSLLDLYLHYWKKATLLSLLHFDQALAFIKEKAQESSEEILRRYIEDFVTIDSFERGAGANKALELLYRL